MSSFPVTVRLCGWTKDFGPLLGRVLVSFESGYRQHLPLLTSLYHRLAMAKNGLSNRNDEIRAAGQAFGGFRPAPQPPWLLPASLTGGVPFYLAELRLDDRLVPANFSPVSRDDGLLPCLADLERNYHLEQRPYRREDVERRQDEFVRIAARRGVAVTAVRVQANSALYNTGRETTLPGLVLITFGEQTKATVDHLEYLADRLYELKEREPRDAGERAAQTNVLASEEGAVYHRRRLLPLDFTGGRAVYAADLWFCRRYLRHGYLDEERRIPCVAEPGEQGAIEMLPYWAPTLPGGTGEVEVVPIDEVPNQPRSSPPPGPRRDRRRAPQPATGLVRGSTSWLVTLLSGIVLLLLGIGLLVGAMVFGMRGL